MRQSHSFCSYLVLLLTSGILRRSLLDLGLGGSNLLFFYVKVNNLGGLITFLSKSSISIIDLLLDIYEERIVILSFSPPPISDSKAILRLISTSAVLSAHCIRRYFLSVGDPSRERGMRTMPSTVVVWSRLKAEKVREL